MWVCFKMYARKIELNSIILKGMFDFTALFTLHVLKA